MANSSRRRRDSDVGKLTFEEALARLDQTVQSLEAGGLKLEEAIRLFEEGMTLARLCSERLSAAELKVARIQTAFGEQMRLVDEEAPEPEDDPE